MSITGQLRGRRLSYATSVSLTGFLLLGLCVTHFAQRDHAAPAGIAAPAQAAATEPNAGASVAVVEVAESSASEARQSSSQPEFDANTVVHESPESGLAHDGADRSAVAAAGESVTPVSPVGKTVGQASPWRLAAAPLPATATGRPRTRDDNGVVFAGQSDQIAKVKSQMAALLAQMAWTANQVLVRESPGGERIAYVLNSPPGDTNTFVLSRQPQLGIGPEMITYTSRLGQKKTLALVSQKEILATMLQAGRAFLFSGPNCLVEALKEQIALRQNVVYWGLRADWVFPEDKLYRYNTGDYWQVMQGDDWTLKPGIKAAPAIGDAFVGKFFYQIGCTSACRFIFTHGIFDFYQAVRPNPAVLARLSQLLDPERPFVGIAPTVDRNRVVVKEGRLMERHTDVPWNHWVPGDWGWIKNPDDKSAEELGSEGCNIIYAGGGFFVNYYPERPPKTLDQAIKRVYGWRFGLEESELDLSADLMQQLRQDPRSGGMLRDVRDYPKRFGVVGPAPPGA
ncbi:MAG TPA: hypothetical protein VNH11_35045 [Pirellulales bacterium]|nr:hypothetical protein [Pirellulales bacterium]